MADDKARKLELIKIENDTVCMDEHFKIYLMHLIQDEIAENEKLPWHSHGPGSGYERTLNFYLGIEDYLSKLPECKE